MSIMARFNVLKRIDEEIAASLARERYRALVLCQYTEETCQDGSANAVIK
jgi:hypothetical protein